MSTSRVIAAVLFAALAATTAQAACPTNYSCVGQTAGNSVGCGTFGTMTASNFFCCGKASLLNPNPTASVMSGCPTGSPPLPQCDTTNIVGGLLVTAYTENTCNTAWSTGANPSPTAVPSPSPPPPGQLLPPGTVLSSPPPPYKAASRTTTGAALLVIVVGTAIAIMTGM